MAEKYGSGRALLLGHGVPQAVPITLDPAAYAGALVYGTDGRLYQSDGTAWVLNIGRQLYNAAAPNATVPVLRVEPDVAQRTEANIDVAIMPRGTGAILAQVPDGTATGGNKRGANAVDLQTLRAGSNQVASGINAVVSGGENNSASGEFAVVSGGFSNSASGEFAVVSGGGGNIASGEGAVAASGITNNASGVNAAVSGGESNIASGINAVVSGGLANIASNTNAVVSGGLANIASGPNSTIPGGNGATTRGLVGYLAYASSPFSRFLEPNEIGSAQYGLNVLKAATNTATPKNLGSSGQGQYLDTPPINSIDVPILPNNSLYTFRIRVCCIQIGGSAGVAGDCKAWDVLGAIKRGANAASTVLLGTPTITVVGANANLGSTNGTGAIIAIVADTGIGALLVRVTGQTNKELRWVATVETTEVTY